MNITPDHIIYESIIKIAIKNYFTRDAAEFINKAFAQEIKISDFIYDELVNRVINDYYLRVEEKKSILTDLYANMKAKGASLSNRGLNDLTKFLYSQVLKDERNNANLRIGTRNLKKDEQKVKVNFYEAKSIYA